MGQSLRSTEEQPYSASFRIYNYLLEMNYLPGSLYQVPGVNVLLVIGDRKGASMGRKRQQHLTSHCVVCIVLTLHKEIDQKRQIRVQIQPQLTTQNLKDLHLLRGSSLFFFFLIQRYECLSVISTMTPLLLKEDLSPTTSFLSSLSFNLCQRSLILSPRLYPRLTLIIPPNQHCAQEFQIHSTFIGALLLKFKPFDLY